MPALLVLACLPLAPGFAQELEPDPLAPAPAQESPPPAVEQAEPPAEAPSPPPKDEEPSPWRLSEAAGLPDWLHIGGTHRTRYEYLWNQFRRGSPGNGRGLSLRTTILLELRFQPLRIGAELLDSRAYFLDDDTPVNTGIVNPLELLQAYVALDLDQELGDAGKLTLRAGRLTFDIGSRRLVARNRFRNTINAFTGIHGEYERGGHSLQAFFVLPIQRRPFDRDSLEDNDVHFDREHLDNHFWGLVYTSAPLSPAELLVEAYLFGLNEDDRSERATRDRELYTTGFRLRRKKAKGELDFQLEAVLQFGRSSLSSAAGARRLDHFAYFAHATLGYTFAAPMQPRLALQGDYASGDTNPNDGDNGRFDTLFGARRFEFGPTGFFGAFARSNIQSLGLRLELKPLPKVSAHIAYRPFWLARKKDAWTTSRVQDPAGRSGRFIGHQIEARVRWDLIPDNVRLEGGFALLARGEFAREAPNANAGEPLVVYSQLILKF
ncbi:MAG TPA: alginate export family protein [Planctomycetes bacterium]|nr:alginate export family protein [Planctomycetota bacterium]